MIKLNKNHLLVIFFVSAFFILYRACESETNNISHHEVCLRIEVVENKIKVGAREFYKFIPVDGGAMNFNYKKADGKFLEYDSINKELIKERESNVYDSKIEKKPSFLIGETPVTETLWELVMNDTILPDDKYVYITKTLEEWKKFIKKLNDRTGRQFEIPTSIQWEYAARGGKKSKNYKYAGSNKLDEVTFYIGDNARSDWYYGGKQKKPNELGLYDMSGGVWELAVADNTITNFSELKKSYVIRGGNVHMDSIYCETQNLFPFDLYEDSYEAIEFEMGVRLILKY